MHVTFPGTMPLACHRPMNPCLVNVLSTTKENLHALCSDQSCTITFFCHVNLIICKKQIFSINRLGKYYTVCTSWSRERIQLSCVVYANDGVIALPLIHHMDNFVSKNTLDILLESCSTYWSIAFMDCDIKHIHKHIITHYSRWQGAREIQQH